MPVSSHVVEAVRLRILEVEGVDDDILLDMICRHLQRSSDGMPELTSLLQTVISRERAVLLANAMEAVRAISITPIEIGGGAASVMADKMKELALDASMETGFKARVQIPDSASSQTHTMESSCRCIVCELREDRRIRMLKRRHDRRSD